MRRLFLLSLLLAATSARAPERWLSWEDACRTVRSLPNATTASGRGGRREERLIAAIATGDSMATRVALQAGAARLRADLAARNVVCDESAPCEVTVTDDTIVRVCVPLSAPSLGARLCDPWALDFQQLGGVLNQTLRKTTLPPRANTLGGASQAERLASGLTNGAACVDVNLTELAAWWSHHRTRRPFLTPHHARLDQHLAAKATSASRSRLSKPSVAQLATLRRLLNHSHPQPLTHRDNRAWPPSRGLHATRRRALNLSESTPRVDTPFGAQSLRRCAFVGSGHDLRCGAARGREIDSLQLYDAVFRANNAQQLDHPQGHFIHPRRAGRRTDFRTNCLFNSTLLPSARNESVCILPRGWWRQPWGHESSNNAAKACCDKTLRSSYGIERLAALAARSAREGGPQFVWLDTELVRGAGTAVENLMHSTGGNTLVAATALCDRVDVYGAGLFSPGPASEKVYVHYYDEWVASCVVDPTKKMTHRPLLTHSWAFKWLKQRLADELTMHVLHAFGVVRWRT